MALHLAFVPIPRCRGIEYSAWLCRVQASRTPPSA